MEIKKLQQIVLNVKDLHYYQTDNFALKLKLRIARFVSRSQ